MVAKNIICPLRTDSAKQNLKQQHIFAENQWNIEKHTSHDGKPNEREKLRRTEWIHREEEILWRQHVSEDDEKKQSIIYNLATVQKSNPNSSTSISALFCACPCFSICCGIVLYAARCLQSTICLHWFIHTNESQTWINVLLVLFFPHSVCLFLSSALCHLPGLYVFFEIVFSHFVCSLKSTNIGRIQIPWLVALRLLCISCFSSIYSCFSLRSAKHSKCQWI